MIPWTIAHQTPLSMGFSRQEYWSRLPYPHPGDLPHPGIEPASLMSPALAGRFFTASAIFVYMCVLACTHGDPHADSAIFYTMGSYTCYTTPALRETMSTPASEHTAIFWSLLHSCTVSMVGVDHSPSPRPPCTCACFHFWL